MLPCSSYSFLLRLSVIFLLSCTQRSQGEVKEKNVAQANSKKNGGSSGQARDWWIASPFRHDSSDHVFFPIRKQVGRRGNREGYFSSRDKEPSDQQVRYGTFSKERRGHFLNLIFWDSRADEHHLLQDSLLHMTRIRFCPMPGTKRNSFLLYRVIDKDRNGDGKYRRNDGTSLYYSESEGSGWSRLTPKGHQVQWVRLLKKEGAMIIRTQKGEKEDLTVHHLRTSLKDPQMATPFFSPSFMKQVGGALKQ